jgi:hypothetical protein
VSKIERVGHASSFSEIKAATGARMCGEEAADGGQAEEGGLVATIPPLRLDNDACLRFLRLCTGEAG